MYIGSLQVHYTRAWHVRTLRYFKISNKGKYLYNIYNINNASEDNIQKKT